jgi:hypothetical protein
MLRKRDADSFCERGSIGLGTPDYYASAEKKEIGDKHEGVFVTYAEGKRYSVFAATGVGKHVLVYCTTTDQTTDFGYDACVEITQPEDFAREIANTIATHFKFKNQLVRVEQSKCVYQHSRVIAGRLRAFSEDLVHLKELSVDTFDVLSDKKYLIKESIHAKDSEYRFAFVMKADIPKYTIIECPQVTRYCRRVR